MTVDLNPKEPISVQEECVPGPDTKVESDCPPPEEDKENVTEVTENENSSESEPKNEEPAEDDLCTIWVGQLHRNVTEEILYELFLQAGPIISARIPNDKEGKKRSFGFVEYVYGVSVPYAMALFEGTKLFGREIRMNSKNPERINVEILRREMVFLIQQNQRQKIAASFSNCQDLNDIQRTSESTVARPIVSCAASKPPLHQPPVLENGQRPRPLLDNASWQSPQLGRGLLGAYPGQPMRSLLDTGPPNVDPWPQLMFQPRPRETAPFMMRPPPPDWNGLRGPCPPRCGILQRNMHFSEDPRRYVGVCPGRMERDMRFMNNYPQSVGQCQVKADSGSDKCHPQTDALNSASQAKVGDSDQPTGSLQSGLKTAISEVKTEGENHDLHNADKVHNKVDTSIDISISNKDIPNKAEKETKDLVAVRTHLQTVDVCQTELKTDYDSDCLSTNTANAGIIQDKTHNSSIDKTLFKEKPDLNRVPNNLEKNSNINSVLNDTQNGETGGNKIENDSKDISFDDAVRENNNSQVEKPNDTCASSREVQTVTVKQRNVYNFEELLSMRNNPRIGDINEKRIEKACKDIRRNTVAATDLKHSVNKTSENVKKVDTSGAHQTGGTDKKCKERAYIRWEDKLLESQGKTPDGGFVFRKPSVPPGSALLTDAVCNTLDPSSDVSKKKIDRPLELLNSSLQSCLNDGNKSVDPIEAFMKMADVNRAAQKVLNSSLNPETNCSLAVGKISSNLTQVKQETSNTTESIFSNSSSLGSDNSSVTKSYSQVLNISDAVSLNNRNVKSYSQVLHPSEPVKPEHSTIKSYSQAVSKPVETIPQTNDLHKQKHIPGVISNGKVTLPGTRSKDVSGSYSPKLNNGVDSSPQRSNNNGYRDVKFFKDRINNSNRETTPTVNQNSRHVPDNRWQRREIVTILKKESDTIKGVSSKRNPGTKVGKPVSRCADPCGIIDEIMKQGQPVEIIQTNGCGEYVHLSEKKSASNSHGKGDIPTSKVAVRCSPIVPSQPPAVTGSKLVRVNDRESGDGGKMLSGLGGFPDGMGGGERGRGRGQTRRGQPPVLGPCRRPVAPPLAPGCHR